MPCFISLFELIGGASVMAGAFVSVLSIPLTITMMTAAIAVHLQYGFSSIRLKALTPSGAEFGPIGYDLNLLYIAGLIALGLSAPTKLSLDFWLKARQQKRPGGTDPIVSTGDKGLALAVIHISTQQVDLL